MYKSILFVLLLLIISIFFTMPVLSQDPLIPVTGVQDTEKVSIDKYVFETALNSADRTITFLQWVIGVFSGVITILFVIFKYRDEKSLEKNRTELKESQEKIEKIRLELVDEENKMSAMLERLQSVSRDYESKISAIENKISALETKSLELDKKTDKLGEMNRYFSVAFSAVERGNYDEAVTNYSKIIDTNPDPMTKITVLNNRGIAYQSMGKSDLALKDYSVVLELDPDLPQTYNNRGVVYESLGDFGKALEDYTKAIKLKRDYADAYNNRGNLYLNMKKYHEAVADFKSLLLLDPNDEIARFSIAETYLIISDYENFAKWVETINQTEVSPKHRSLALFFENVNNLLAGKDTAKSESKLKASLKENDGVNWVFRDIRSWLTAADIDGAKKTRVKKLMEIVSES